MLYWHWSWPGYYTPNLNLFFSAALIWVSITSLNAQVVSSRTRDQSAGPASKWVAGTSALMAVGANDGFHDSFPWFSSRRSVAKKNRSESFVHSVAFPVVVNHGMHGSQLSQSDSAPPSFSDNRSNGHQSTHNITIKFLSAEGRFMSGIGLLLPRPVSLHHSANLTHWTASQRVGVESGRMNDRDEREITEMWNQVGSFLLKSRSFELIRSQTHQ